MRTSMSVFGIVALLIWHTGPIAGQASAATAGRTTPQSDASSDASASTNAADRARADAPVPPLERIVSLHLENVRLNDALREINKQARLGLTYTPRVVPVNNHVTIEEDSIAAGEALERVLQGTGVKAIVTSAGTVALVREEQRSERADSAVGAVIGRVLDAADGRPLAGAIVTVKGTELRTVTTDSGLYGIPKVPAGMRTLVVRLIGYRSAEQPVLVVENQATRTDFELKMAMSRLQETVTTATGRRRRVELGNDITLINADSVVATQPVTNVTSLLEGRVPGLSVLHSSGAPGDPSRLRLRGLASILRSNDPIVVVDGIRVYSDQSSDRSNNLAQSGFTTPSPIDQIDPSSIETIEVLKGPSAATLYGQDAANGVIVITTRKGRPGPPRWTVSATRGATTMPGSYPVGYFGWGHKLADDSPILCAVRDPTCAQDSVVRFQLLNDPELTVLGHGDRTAFTAGVSGGSESLTYSVSGNYSDETGLIRLPDVEVARYTELRGVAPPGWMRRPQRYTSWGAATRLGARIGARADVSLTAMLQRGTQRRSSLEHQLDGLMGTYFDRATGQYYVANPVSFMGYDINDQVMSDYFRRVEDVATTFTNGVNATWRPLSWLTGTADAGLQLLNRDDEALLPPGMPTSFVGDTVGSIGIGHGQSLMRTINARLAASTPLPHGFHFRLALGANYTSTSTRDFSITGRGLSPGTSAISGARDVDRPSQGAFDITSFGWYVEPSISHDRFWLSTGLRLDGGSTFGTHVKLPSFPKLSASYLISDEPFFPFKRIFNTLRLRVAYGQAGTWPGPADRLRLFQQQSRYLGSTSVNTLELKSIGNTHLKPERSRELEGGFDADVLGNRVSISLTGYRKTRYDALMSVPIPASVYGGGSILKNVGVIRNTGLELSLDVQPVQTDPITVSTQLQLGRNRNRVLSLANDVGRFCTSGPSNGCVAEGYPLYGVWARPIVGYADKNGDGVIGPDEVLVADSIAFMGEQLPNYEASLHTSLSFFRSAVTVSGSVAYQNGLTQSSYATGNNVIFSQGLNDPNAPLGAQAAAVAMPLTAYGTIQTVSTLRFTSLAVAYHAGPSVARHLGARSLSIALQGTNLGLWTDYRGKDPNVSATATGNGVIDRNVLPTPRTWQVRVSASY